MTLKLPQVQTAADVEAIIRMSSRCTQAVLAAFGIESYPLTGSGIIAYLREAGYTLKPVPNPPGRTAVFLKQCGNDKNYVIYVPGHVLAYVNGHVVDTAPGNRRIEFVWEVLQ